MPNYAKITLTLDTNSTLEDVILITASGSAIPVTVNIYEVAKSVRTTASEYKVSVTKEFTTENLRDAILFDYISGNPFIISYTSNIITIEATSYGVTFAGYSIPTNITVEITAEVLPTLAIASVAVVESDTNSKCTFCKQVITLKEGLKGTPPYNLYVPTGAWSQNKFGVTEAELNFEMYRSNGFASDPTYWIFTIEDSLGHNVSGNAGGMQYIKDSNVSAEFIAINQLKGDLILSINLQPCLTKDQAIVLEAKVTDANELTIVNWVEVYNDATGAANTYTFNDLNLQELNVSLRDNFGCIQTNRFNLANPSPNIVPFVVIPKANSLNFIDESLYSKPQNFTNRLFCDFTFKNKLNTGYLQKYLKTSNLWIQIQTTYETLNAYLVGQSVVDISSTISPITSDSGVSWYEIRPILTSLSGVYQIRVKVSDPVAGTKWFSSEFFEVRDSYERISIVKWKNTDNLAYDDGIIWADEMQEMIIDAEFVIPVIGGEKTTEIDTNNRLVNTHIDNTAFDLLRIYKMPYYLQERFSLALGHSYFEVNGTEYQTEEVPEMTLLEGNLMFKADVRLRRNEYENY